MMVYDSADARTALMTSYLSRYPYPQAGATSTAAHHPLPHQRLGVLPCRTPKQGFTSRADDHLALRGRTIYNADAVHPVTRSQKANRDSEREGGLKLGMMAVSGREMDESRERAAAFWRQATVLARNGKLEWGIADSLADDAVVLEMFELYIRVEECGF